jgi:hypothetical protein
MPSLKLPNGNGKEHGMDGDLYIHRDVAADQCCRAPVLPLGVVRHAWSWKKSLGNPKFKNSGGSASLPEPFEGATSLSMCVK